MPKPVYMLVMAKGYTEVGICFPKRSGTICGLRCTKLISKPGVNLSSLAIRVGQMKRSTIGV